MSEEDYGFNLKFIGALRQISGKTQLTVNFQEGMSLKDLLNKLCREMPQLEKLFSDQTCGFKVKHADTRQRQRNQRFKRL